MAEFPLLKTSAVAQYPAQRSTEHATRVLRFLDGSEQRFREYGTALRRWTIALALLDESELTRLREFCSQVRGRAGSFVFVDPWDGTEYADCSLAGDEVELELSEEGRGRAVLIVKENRS